ncbi:MAG: hypothetical protein WEA99_06270 [Brumimicrobium sp.]
MKCQCDKIKNRKYISSPDQLGEALAYAKELQNNNVIELLTDEGDNSDYFHKTYKCTKCNTNFLLSCEAYHGSGGSFGLNSHIKSEYISRIDYLCQRHRSPEKYRGNDIYDSSKNGEWVYYDCYFDEKSIRERFKLPQHVKYYVYDGRVAGQESGFIDEQTNDAVLGCHPYYARKNNLKLIK